MDAGHGQLAAEAAEWIAGDPDTDTKAELAELVAAEDWTELADRMAGPLQFGTAGIRGKVGAGPNRMNRAVVIRTTKGLADYLERRHGKPGLVLVGFDARPTSEPFARDAVAVLMAAGFDVSLFARPTPTPIVGFAARRLESQAAIVVTASHNPPADNGYKVFDANAAQIIPPVDYDIAAAIERVGPATDVASSSEPPRLIEDELLSAYRTELVAVLPQLPAEPCRVVYTPLHGVGWATMESVFESEPIALVPVPEQVEPDGTFPTVSFPNPEEPGALDLALQLAENEGVSAVIANDPDADRLAVALPSPDGWQVLSGNDIGVLLSDFLLEFGRSDRTRLTIASVVSTPMAAAVAARWGAEHEITLTGFKWIANAALAWEAGGGEFVFGFEEALGYAVGGISLDKDGISAAAAFGRMLSFEAARERSVLDRLDDLRASVGTWQSVQQSVALDALDGSARIAAALDHVGSDPPARLAGVSLDSMTDYRSGEERRTPWLPNARMIELAGSGVRVIIRPSGTEPKVKIYADVLSAESVAAAHARAEGLAEALAVYSGLVV